MNKIQLIGRVTKDIELRRTPSNKAVVSFVLAINRRGRENKSDFIPCVAWETKAELMARYVNKGDRIGIVGHIESRSYEKDGKKFYTTDIIVEELEFLQNKKTVNEFTKVDTEDKFTEPENEFMDVEDYLELPF